MTPSEMGELADLYAAKRQERIQAGKVAKKLEDEENQLKGELMNAMIKDKMAAVGGRVSVVNIKTTDEPTVTDWPKLYEFIKEHDAFDLLHRRLTGTAVKLRWEDDITVPGIGTFPVSKLTVSGAK